MLLFILAVLLGILALNAYYGSGQRRASVEILPPPDVSAFSATADAAEIQRLYVFLFSPGQARESLLAFSETRLIDHQALTAILLDPKRSLADRWSMLHILLLRCFADEAGSDAATAVIHQVLRKTSKDLRGLVVKEVPTNATEARQKSRRDSIKILRWSALHTLAQINPVSDLVELFDVAGLTDEEKEVALVDLARMVPQPEPPEMVLMWPGVDPRTVPQSVMWRGVRWTVTVGEWELAQ